MNFFKSVFSDEPDPDSKSESESESELESSSSPKQRSEIVSDPNSPQYDANPNPILNPIGGWSFGGLIKTLSERSESVIDTYRRDLKEFGDGLKKEIEVAHGSLENVSHKIDEIGSSVLKNTAQIISHGKDAILAADQDSDSSDSNTDRSFQQRSLNEQRYSRFDSQVHAMQGDLNTYCEEPEDFGDYEKWKKSGFFVLQEKSEEIERLKEENGVIESVYKRVVPSSVDHELFWSSYFYKVYELKQAEEFRASLVKRAISTDEEELSWDVDDDEEIEHEKIVKVSEKSVGGDSSGGNEGPSLGSGVSSKVRDENSNEQVNDVASKGGILESNKFSNKDSVVSEKGDKSSSVEPKILADNVEKTEPLASKSEDKAILEGNDSNKRSDISIILSQPTLPEEEDLGWDEIEDLSSIDEKSERKPTQGGSSSPNRADLRKRLSAAEEDEDLNWDIEDDDDDEPVKA